jgi:hypothetical protein
MTIRLALIRSCLAALALLPRSALAQQDAPQVHVRGVVAALHADTLDVRTRAGEVVHLTLPEQVSVGQVEKADLSAVSEGTFIGTTAVAQPDGTLRATEVHVFPESMRGRGEGHRPWDLAPGSSMTNATVAGAPAGESSMTNATIARATGSGAERVLTLRYPGGEQTVRVSGKTPIVRIAPGDRALLVPGAHVFAIATGAGEALTARAVLVGKGKVVPPM